MSLSIDIALIENTALVGKYHTARLGMPVIYLFIDHLRIHYRWTDSKGVRQVVKKPGKPGENLCKIELPKSRNVLTNVYGTLF